MSPFGASCFFAMALAGAACAVAYDTTIAYQGGRRSGTFAMDGRANGFPVPRTDVPDTVRFPTGLVLSRVVNKGQACILGCSHAVPTWLRFQAEGGSLGFAAGADSGLPWEAAASFPDSLRSLDSIPDFLSPCGGAPEPYGLGFAVSSDDATSFGAGCGDVSTFRKLPGHDHIVYHQKDGVSLKLQVAGFEVDTVQCETVVMPLNCTYGNKVIFRYVLTDSAGYFGTDPVMSLRPGSRPEAAEAPKSRKRDLYRLILGRRFLNPDD